MVKYPEKPTLTEPYFQDGKYGREIGRVSPEGNIYGHSRMLQYWEHLVWWDGMAWQPLEVSGRAISESDLPKSQRAFGEIWEVRFLVDGEYLWKQFYWDSTAETWEQIRWMYSVDAFSDLPIPGYFVGQAHIVSEPDVLVFWDGFTWRRHRHSSLDNDEPERHLPPGFLKWYTPDARVVYINPNELVLEAATGGSGSIWVNGEYVAASKATTVFASLPSLEWDSQENRIVTAEIQGDTEYWIYLANTKDPAFYFPNVWDFKGKLFLSRSADINGYLSDAGAGINARLVGRVQTDANGLFLREINISLISRTVSFPETFREHSDYQVKFVDYDTLRFALSAGLYGQIYVGGSLEYIGADYELGLDGPVVVWSNTIPRIALNANTLEAEKLYYIYFCSNVDEFNFNAINPDTNRPWRHEDKDAETNYVAALDLRLKPFLSKQTPDNGRLSEQWPGFYTRHIGQVRTDGNGRFVNARDLSAIRQPTLNPTDFDGLAEIHIANVNPDEFQVCRKRGTSGIVNVCGEGILTQEQFGTGVHKVLSSSTVYNYTESNLSAPLSSSGKTVSQNPGVNLYVYMANVRTFWGTLAGKLFVSEAVPQSGYLSKNWPGSNARWIATIRTDAQGKFTGSFIVESVASVSVTIDDFDVSLTKVWSSSKVSGELTAVIAAFNAQKAYAAQVNNGLPLKLHYINSGTVRLAPVTGAPVTIYFPDLATWSCPAEGVSLWVSGGGAAYSVYYVYINKNGTLYITGTAPNNQGPKLHVLNNDILVGYIGLASNGNLGGEWSVYSFWNQEARTYTSPNVWGTTYLYRDALVIPPGKSASVTSSGSVSYTCGYGGATWCTATCNLPNQDAQNSYNWGDVWMATISCHRRTSPYPTVNGPACYPSNSGPYHSAYGEVSFANPNGTWTSPSVSGDLIVTIQGS